MNLFDDKPELTPHKFKIRGGKTWHLTQEFYDELKDTYPLKDVEGQVREAKLWCKANTRKRKTAVGMKKFLLGWLSRADETGYVTTEPEKSRTDQIRDRNLKEDKRIYESIVKAWPVFELKQHKQFMAACCADTRLRDWALEIRPELKTS